MAIYKKRSESTLVSHAMRYLAAQENVGTVLWYSRLQSGAVKVVKGYKGKRFEHYMSLCRKGTPDIMVILPLGEVLWLELKTKTGSVRPEQEEFRDMVAPLEGHYHLIMRDLDELDEFLKQWRDK
jgi:hypothetical protein